jgi:hypothetical protein
MPVCVLSQLGKPGDTAPLARKDRIGKGFMKSGVGQTKRIGVIELARRHILSQKNFDAAANFNSETPKSDVLVATPIASKSALNRSKTVHFSAEFYSKSRISILADSE